MLRSTKSLEDARIHAIDGDIGHVQEFYFDDRNWQINYVVMNIGSWLHGKLVLLSPEAITSVEGEDQPIIQLALTKEQVRRSLDAQTHRPISLQQPHDYYLYLGLPHYLNLAEHQDPGSQFHRHAQFERGKAADTLSDPDFDAHLRSSKIVGKYHIIAVDGEIGHLEGFIIDDETWTIRYAMADTRNWWPGKKVLLATEWIYWISWAESNAYVGFRRERIRNAPEFHPERPLTREFEAELHAYYTRKPYWESRRCA
jgi:hypothetical protein